MVVEGMKAGGWSDRAMVLVALIVAIPIVASSLRWRDFFQLLETAAVGRTAVRSRDDRT
jgi:hypothetical protein